MTIIEDDIAELAIAHATRAAFRRDVIGRLRGAVSFDCVSWGPIPAGRTGTSLEYYEENIPVEAIAKMADDPSASVDIARAQRVLSARKVAVDGGFSTEAKRRSPFFVHFLSSLHVRTYASVLLGNQGATPRALRITRERRAFADRDVAVLRRIRPVLLACEAMFDARRGESREPVLLTPRQREIVDYVTRGLTNEEIARVLRISRNTVRNRLAEVFQRLGVTRRAELVALVLA